MAGTFDIERLKLMKIDQVLQRTQAQDIKNPTQTENAKDVAKAKSQAGPRIKTDTVTISEQARNLQRTESELKTLHDGIDEQSVIRQDKVAIAKAKLAAGQLEIDQVVEETAEAIHQSGALSDIINGDHLLMRARLSQTENLEAGAEKLAQVRQRIKSGYYNSPEVANEIADRMMEDLLA